MDEQEAIRRCLAGDADAFGVLVRQYQAPVLALCLRMTGSREDGADLAQQAFVQAFRHLEQYDPALPFKPWLFKIATNACIGFLRRKRRDQVPLEDGALERIGVPADGAPALAELAEDRERVREAVAELPQQYRTAVVLHYFQGLTYQEIARQTGLSIGTISTHLYRAKQWLKRRLTEEEVAPGDSSRSHLAAAVSGR